MNHSIQWARQGAGLFLLFGICAWFFFTAPIVYADEQAQKDEVNRKTDAQIQTLEQKIAETKNDIKEDQQASERKIKEYEDKIAEVKRESGEKKQQIANANEPNRNEPNRNNNEARNEEHGGITSLSHNFHEWRLKRAINRYDDKIDDLKYKSQQETDAEKRRDLEAKIQKLDAKFDAAKAKLNDLRTTNGANWDKIEQDLEANLKDIDHDYKEANQANM